MAILLDFDFKCRSKQFSVIFSFPPTNHSTLGDWNSQLSTLFHFESQLNDACYQEAIKHVTDNHKLRKILESKRELAYNILYSGGDINAILGELVKAFKSADIEYAVPNSLLQLSK